ncbi:MAG: DUF1479 family protein [Ktedonobacteraceae bacterium]
MVPQAVPPENLQEVVAAVWDFMEMDGDDPGTWYPPDRRGSIVPIHQHQSLWDNRQYPRVHGAFADILGTEKLWVSLDRAGMKPPISADHPAYDDRGFVHWDLDTSRPLPAELGLQGVLCLTDTTPEMGGFCCIPGFHRVLAEWLAAQPPDHNPRSPDLSRLPEGMKVTPIPARAGDLIIWNRLLAHGNGRNEGTRPRLAQYITMHRPSDNEEHRQGRIACWRERRAPAHWERDVPERFKGREQRFPPAILSPLGRQLLGLDSW